MNANAPVSSLFQQQPEVFTKLATALGQPGISGWETLAVELSKKNREITSTFIQTIEKSHSKDFERAKTFLATVSKWTHLTVRIMGVALWTIGQGVIACEHFGASFPILDSEPLHKRFARDSDLTNTLIKFFSDPQNPTWEDLACTLSGLKCGREISTLIHQIPLYFGKKTDHPKIFFKEISQLPELSSRDLGMAIKELHLDHMAYQHFGIPLAVAPKPPVGIQAYLGTFLENTGMEDDIVEAMSGNSAPNWYSVGRALSKQEGLQAEFSKAKVDQVIWSSGNSSVERSRNFLHSFTGFLKLPNLIIALYNTDKKFWPLCEEICERAGDKDYYKKLPELVQQTVVKFQPISNPQRMGCLFYHFLEKSGLDWTIWETLSKNDGPNWENVANMLVAQPKYVDRKNHLFDQILKEYKQTEDRSAAFLTRASDIAITVGEFVTALAGASAQFKELTRLICLVAGDDRFLQTLQFPKEMPAVKGPEVKADAQLLFDQLLESEKALKEQNERLKKAFEDAQKNIQQANAVQADPLKCRSCLKNRVTKSIDCGHAGYCDLCIGIIKSCPACQLPVRNPRTVFFN